VVVLSQASVVVSSSHSGPVHVLRMLPPVTADVISPAVRPASASTATGPLRPLSSWTAGPQAPASSVTGPLKTLLSWTTGPQAPASTVTGPLRPQSSWTTGPQAPASTATGPLRPQSSWTTGPQAPASTVTGPLKTLPSWTTGSSVGRLRPPLTSGAVSLGFQKAFSRAALTSTPALPTSLHRLLTPSTSSAGVARNRLAFSSSSPSLMSVSGSAADGRHVLLDGSTG